jgi:16S rRNA (cytidine1402-2'-O)-methyltransferase
VLYLVATPIGNLSDITLRAIEVLKACDYILCEDTRHSVHLLKHYAIVKPLKSYHKFNEASKLEAIIEDLKEGKTICLISDAGTPAIADPGELIVKHCIEENISVQAIPGPCAAIQAMSCSGFPTAPFQFWGFLKRKENELKKELLAILSYPGTTICYETPHRLIKTLTLLHMLAPDRELVIGRELTKKFEEFIRGTAQQLLHHWQTAPPKGEIVLLIGPPAEEPNMHWEDFTPEEHVQWVEEAYCLRRKEAIKLVAELRDIPKRELYQKVSCQADGMDEKD